MHRLRFILAIAVVCGACSDDVQTIYANRQDALGDGLVAKGWLPSFIPASAQQIRTNNNLDLNTSHGSFGFKAEDWSAFVAHLKPHAGTASPFVNWRQTEEKYKSYGYEAWWHEEEDTTWVFFCKPREEKCEHFMWLNRSANATK